MAPISIPVASRLPSALRIRPSHPIVTRILGRLTRPSLLSLALDWLDDDNQALTAPFLRQRSTEDDAEDAEEDDAEDAEEDDFYAPAASLADLRDHYTDWQDRKGSKREVLDRLLEGDWRHGITLYQLAMADVQYLYDHPTSQKWTAFSLLPLKPTLDADGRESGQTGETGETGGTGETATAVLDKTSLVVPRFHPSTFLRNLQAQILPDVKVHYNFDRHKHLPLLLLRIFILDSPYNTARAVATDSLATVEASRTLYVAFPDASPFVYLSSSQTIELPPGASTALSASASASTTPAPGRETKSLRSLVVEAIPKALSRPRERYALKPTSIATRNLAELLHRRGAGRTNAAGGGWAIYADEQTIESPLSTVLPTPPLSEADEDRPREDKDDKDDVKKRKWTPLSVQAVRAAKEAKRRRLVAAARFGPTGILGDEKGVERVDVVLQDAFPGNLPADDDDDDNDNNETAEEADRRRTRGARRSQVGLMLAREAEAQDDADLEAGTAGDDETTSGHVWRPQVALTFHGTHVFAGLRQLVEAGVIDGEAMPGWMTGEEGVTVGAVRNGRIRGHKGSGMP